MKRAIWGSLVLLLITFLLNGCLQVEKKQYKIKLTGTNSGSGSVHYINIVSQKEDGNDKSFKDFGELIDDYIKGDKILDQLPGLKIKDKKLYEKDGMLCGEFTFEFDSLETFRIYQYDKDSPYMLIMEGMMNGEQYSTSNGDFGKVNAQIVFWPKDQKVFEWETKTQVDPENNVSLLPKYEMWKESEGK